MKALSVFFVTSFLLYGISCEKFTSRKYFVKLENKSNTKLYIAVGRAGEGTAGIYPDTSLSTNKPIFSAAMPNSIGYVLYTVEKIEKVFEELPKDTLSVYVFNADSVDIQGWDTIRRQYKILKRYDLSFADVQQNDFIITYP